MSKTRWRFAGVVVGCRVDAGMAIGIPVFCCLWLLSTAVAEPSGAGPKEERGGEVLLRVEKEHYGGIDQGVVLDLTLRNDSARPLAIVTNRIICHRNIKFEVYPSAERPTGDGPGWYLRPAYIADYGCSDPECFLILRPGESYVHRETWFAEPRHGLLHLLRLTGKEEFPNGAYAVRAHFSGWGGKGVSVLDASEEVRAILWTEIRVSNEATIVLDSSRPE